MDKLILTVTAIRCSTSEERGSCKNNGKVCVDKIGRALPGELGKELSKPTCIDGFIRACNRERRELNAFGKPVGKEFEFAAAEATKLLKRRSGGFINHFLGV
ncbi:hypothetical protein [Ruegeria sp. HKCCA0370]|uniref:hypothetical protein n=1 Tax=Ruegeria sp. HKCCA0370 TaxID=2682995 RepID=UPI001487C0C1|nr:hypothetical protein [Ruegeria sp. HKCCA0370]